MIMPTHDGGHCTEIWSSPALDCLHGGVVWVAQGTGEHWARPVVCGGRLYVRHGDVLMAFDVEKKWW